MRHFSFYLITLCVCFVCRLYAQTTPVDPLFEMELINLGIDTNGVTNTILNSDAQAVTTLDLSGATNITDISGINAFTNLTDLNLGNNQISSVQPTALIALVNFRTNDNSALNTIDFSQNTLLETVFMHGPFPGTPPPITQIDLSQNLNLISFEGDFLDNVTDIIFPVTPTLVDIDVRYLADETFDLSLLSGLEDLRIGGWRSTVDITLPNVFTNLRSLRISSIDIPTIDISDYINLENIYFWGTYVENLLLPNSTTLTDIFIILHDIQNPLDFSVLPNLEDLDITSNRDTPLVVDISQNLVLENIDLSRNDMNTIDVTQNAILRELRLDVNNFSSLDVTQNTALYRLSARNNQLPSVDLTQNIILEYLDLSFNLIPNLDVTQNVLLRSINISNNLFTTTGLDLTQNGQLTSLNVSYNQIESLDITQNIELFSFDLSHNLFPGNDILEQFAAIVSNQGRLRGQLIANNNLLEGPVPDFYGLYDPTIQTRRFELFINENRFHFGDFENQHLGLIDLTTTQSIGPSPDVVIRNYLYAPQAKVNAIENFSINAGDDITLTTTVRGEQNHYTWFKDGVAIPDAPDAPEYTITNADSCDEGVYYSEIRSDLVPFENSDPPGTAGKNLLLVRNDITLTINAPAENCSSLITPVAGSTAVPINQTIEWSSNLGACGYMLSLGTIPGGTDIFSGDVEDVTSYNLGSNLPPNTVIYVTITPYFASGNSLNCTNTTDVFTTGTIEEPTTCTTLLPQYTNATLPVFTNLEWESSPYATGYYITIGTTPNGNDVYDLLDVGNTTVFNPPSDFDSGVTYYVTIIPYNGLGDATGCGNTSFTTESTATVIDCTSLINPVNGATNVAIGTDLEWNAVTNAIGYRLAVGTTPGATDIFTGDVGNITLFNLPDDLPQNTQIFVTLIPYDGLGDAVNCTEESFVTELLPPTCTVITSITDGDVDVPIDTTITWDAVNNATEYNITIGTSSGSSDLYFESVSTPFFNPPTDLPQNTQIFVAITPTNSEGSATNCTEISFTTELLAPECTQLITPLDMATDISVDTLLEWNAVPLASGYRLFVGTTSGASDIFSGDVGNVTSYDLVNDLPYFQTIYITIQPYNATGNAVNCDVFTFTTERLAVGCIEAVTPLNEAINVPVDTVIEWTPAVNATNYRINIGTEDIPGTNNIFFGEVDAPVTSINLPNDLPANEIIFVEIQPYNTDPDSIGGCVNGWSFTTTEILPDCTTLLTPMDGASNVSVNTPLTWEAVSNATGYIINVGTQPDGTDIVNEEDVGNTLTYNFSSPLPQDTEIFVSIWPYNAVGVNMFCVGPLFYTELLVPQCTALTNPMDSDIDVPLDSNFTWDAVDFADGYILNIGTASGSFDIIDQLDVGNVTEYTLNNLLPDETILYASVIAYNASGNAINCSEIQFLTEEIIPECPFITVPSLNQPEVSVTPLIVWDAIDNADGYIISMGTSQNENDLLSNFDVGDVTSFYVIDELPGNTTIFLKIEAYNGAGTSENCFSLTFTTENTDIIAPKYFTPNGDGNHDFWNIEDPNNEIRQVFIFDRFGKLIKNFGINSPGWDGNLGGRPLPSDDYWYKAEVTDGSYLTGHFTLKR